MSVTRNLRDATITIKDGAAATLVIPISSGDLAWTEKRPTTVLKNRGRIDSRKNGDEMEMDLSFSFMFEQYSHDNGGTGISVIDALKGKGGASAWVSTDSCGPFAVDIEFKIENPCSPGEYEVLVFPKFHADTLSFKEADPADTVAVAGTSLATEPTRTYED